MSASTVSSPVGRDWRDDLVAVTRWAVLGAAVGALAGGVVGGVGGRAGMFVLRLTSPDSVHGLRSDDGFIIGRFSLDTGFLVFLTAAIGAANGLVYVASRSFLPERIRVAGWTASGGLVGGSLIVHPDGVDFRFLEPRWLAIALFVIIPAAGAGATALLVERWAASDWWWRDRRRTTIASLPAVAALVFVPLVVVALVGVLLILAAGRSATIRAMVSSDAMKVAGTAALVVVLVLGGAALLADVRGVIR